MYFELLQTISTNCFLLSVMSGNIEGRINMILKKNLKDKNGLVAIVIALALLFAVVGSVGAYAANNNDDKVSDENVVTEKIGGSSPADDNNSIFLDSYYE